MISPNQLYRTTYCRARSGYIHDDVIKWKHFRRYWPFVQGIHRSPVNSPHKGQWRGAFMFSLISVWINDWVNNGEAGDLWRHRGHYDVTALRGADHLAPGFHHSAICLNWLAFLTASPLLQVMACRLFDANPLPAPTLNYYQLDPKEQIIMKFDSKQKVHVFQEHVFDNVVCRLSIILLRSHDRTLPV